MIKTWKQLLETMAIPAARRMPTSAIFGRLARCAAVGTLAVGTLMAPAYGQDEDDGVVVLGGRTPSTAVVPQSYDDGSSEDGSVQLGDSPGTPSYYEGIPGDSGPMNGGPMNGAYGPPSTIYPQGGGGYIPAGESIGYAVTQDPDDILLRVGRRNRDVYGIDEGFTSLGAYMSRNEDANTVWFVNPRLLLTDQGRGGLNLGFGQKAYYPDLDRVFSLSGWWDFDSGHQSDYHQVGLSFEMIGQNLSLRSNANFVVSRDEHRFGATNLGAPIVTDEGLMVQQQTVFNEYAYNQADVELAAPMPFAGEYGWEWAGGAYFLFGGDGRDATGVKGRVESQVTEDIWVNFEITSDRVFDTNVSVNFELTVPNAPPSRWWRRPSVRDHLWASVRRQYRVATDVVESRQTVLVMGQGGRPMRLGLIDPNVTNDPLLAFGGSGTADDPWRSFADYADEALETQQMFGIIAVRSRDDQSDLNLNTTIVLLDNQALLGEGVIHSLDGINPIDIPTIDPNGLRPLITNSDAPGQDVVTLSNNNQVAGFFIDAGGTASGIVGDGVRGFNINQVEMTNVIDGIRIRSLSDANGRLGIIRDNVITGIGLGSPRGISIEHESGILGLAMTDNTVSNFRGEDANQNGILDPSEDINNNMVLDPGEDIDFDGRLDLSEDLNLNGVLDRGFGIYVSATNGSTILADDPLSMTLPLGFLDNTLNGNGTSLALVASGGALISADVQRNIAAGSTDLGEDANGNQILDPGEDLNGDGVLNFGSGFSALANGGTVNLITFIDNSATGGAGNGGTFQTFNGGSVNFVNPTIDPSTMLPAVAFTGNTFSGNALDGMFARADSGSIIFDQIQNSVFSNNGDDGLDLETDNGGTIFVRDPLVANTFSGNGDNGVETTSGLGGGVTLVFGASGAAGTANTIMGNGQNANPDTGAGIFLSTAGGVLNASFSGLTSTGNNGSGAVILLNGGQINIAGGITNNTFVNNREHGLAIINNEGGRLITPFVSDNDFSNNDQAGLFLGGSGLAPSPSLETALTDLGSITRNNFDRTIRGDEGILIAAENVRIVGTLTQNSFVGRLPTVDPMTNLVTEGGAGRGIGGAISGSSTLPGPGGLSLVIGTGVDSDRNVFLNNGDAHIGLEMSGNTVNSIVVENGDFSNAFDRKTVGLPLGQAQTGTFQGEGIHYIIGDTATLTGGVIDSTLSDNEGDGLLIEIAGNNDFGNFATSPAAALVNFDITGNTITGNGIEEDVDGDGLVDFTLASGIRIRRTERGQFNDLLIAENLIEDNTSNGITIASLGADLLNLPNMRADSVMILDNEITTNRLDGIEFLIGADADIVTRIDDNLITNNGLNGIEVREQIQSSKDSRSLTGLWTDNVITGNGDDGIDLSGRVGNNLVELGEAGIYTVGPPAPGTTFPSLGLVRSYGLVIGDETINSIPDIGGLEFVRPSRNLIADNAGDGIDITAQGVVTIGNNAITRNGTLDAQGRIRHAGINIDGAERGPGQSGNFSGQFPTPDDDIDLNILAFREVLVISNLITRNIGDGIELLSEPEVEFVLAPQSPGAIETALNVVNNEITLNEGRGIDILQRMGDSDPLDRDNEDPDGVPGVFDLGGGFTADVSIVGNHIKGNQLEAIYVVQTIDNAQNQVDPSAVASNANGESLRAQADNVNMGDRPALRLDVHDNQVIGNGEGIVDFPATGLVIRVGTSGSSGVLFNFGPFGAQFVTRLANFFATSGFNPEDINNDGILDNDLDGDGFLDAATVTGAGVSTSITGNIFNGNFGDDVLFHSFTATEDPATASGTWNEMEFDVMGYQPDPLARLDVIFSNNRLNSIEANNREDTIGTSPGNAGLGLTQPGAYYNDADGVFKSRLSNIMVVPGPYGSAVRIRNATRFASRWNSGPFILPPDPLISPDMGNFAYPGMGNSTFRVRGTGNFFIQGLNEVAFTLDQAFIFDLPELDGDPDLVDAFGEARGVFPSLAPGGEPWGWDDLEPGTPPTP